MFGFCKCLRNTLVICSFSVFLKIFVILIDTAFCNQRQRKFQKDRLMDEFTTALKNFQMSQRRQKEREKEAIQRTKNKASSPMV